MVRQPIRASVLPRLPTWHVRELRSRGILSLAMHLVCCSWCGDMLPIRRRVDGTGRTDRRPNQRVAPGVGDHVCSPSWRAISAKHVLPETRSEAAPLGTAADAATACLPPDQATASDRCEHGEWKEEVCQAAITVLCSRSHRGKGVITDPVSDHGRQNDQRQGRSTAA